MVKIVLAGGSGWLGSALASALVADGWDVVVLSRSARAPAVAGPVRGVAWDGRTLGPWADEIDGCDAVVNFAGAPIASGRWTETRKHLLIASRIEPTAALVLAIERAQRRPEILVNTSAVGYYGDRGSQTITEDEPSGADFLAQLAASWEATARRASESGVRVVLPRVGVVLGIEGALPRLALPFRLFIGGPLGSGEQWVSWVHLDDVVGLYRLAIERKELRGPMNVTAPNPVTNRELAATLGSVLHRPSWIPVPAPALRLAVGELAGTLIGGQRVVPAVAQHFGYEFREPTLMPALRQALDAAA